MSKAHNALKILKKNLGYQDLMELTELIMLYQMPEVAWKKIDKEFTIGPDLWGNPFDETLKAIVMAGVDKLNLNKR